MSKKLKELTLEEKRLKVRDMRPIDDVFFEMLANSKEVCQEMLRVILEDDKLVVIDSITQSSERNLYGRSVRLDALCELSNGTRVNIEVQRSNNDDHLRRARFNASSITIKESNPSTKFEDIPDLYIVYISEFDFLNGGRTIYHIDKVLRETKTVVDDGLHEIFVNTVIDDKTNIAELMSCFLKKEVNNPKFPALSAEVRRLKETERGVESMCEIMKKYEQLAVNEERIRGIQALIKKGCDKDFILDLDVGYTEEEYEEAQKEMLQTV